MVPGYCTETVTRAHFEREGLVIFQQPLAYCTVSENGYCRYAEHLAISLQLLGDDLLTRHPELCACEQAPCWGWEFACRPDNTSGTCITPIQPVPSRAVDPGHCQLAQRCLRGLAAARGGRWRGLRRR